jgi:type I restriction enzyme S subunit
MIGSAQKALTIDAIRNLEVPLPPLPEQKAIAHVLGSLDDKIELNRRMNETLEGMAQALFKSWFVDFDPVIDNALETGNLIPEEFAARAQTRKKVPNIGNKSSSVRKMFPDSFQPSELGPIPTGWEVSTIGNELDTVLGGTPARKKEEFWTDGTVGWINSGKVNEFRIIEPPELITEEAVKKSATKLLPKRTTLLAITGATLGQVSLNEIECCANQSVVGVIGKESVPSEYVYLWVKNIIHKLVASQTGGAQQHINKGNVQEASILLPPEKVMECFVEHMRPTFDQVSLSCFESKNLAKLRDTLLPKLISGELRIEDAEKMVGSMCI